MPSIWKIGRVMRLEYLKAVRRPVMLIATLMPLVGYLFFQVAQVAIILTSFDAGERRSAELLILDLPPTRATLPIGLVDSGASLPVFSPPADAPIVLFEREESARRALFAGELRTLFVLAEDYLASGDVTAYATGDALAARLRVREDAALLREALATALTQRADGTDAPLLARASAPLRLRPVLLADAASASEELLDSPQQRLNRFLFAYILIVLLNLPTGYLLHSISEEKESRVIEIVLSSVTPTELMAGKLLGLVGLGLTQALLWLGAALALSRDARAFLGEIIAAVGWSQVALVLLFWLLGCLLYGTISVVAGSLGANKRDSQQMLGGALFFLPLPVVVMGIAGAVLPSTLDGRAAQALSLFPLTAPTMMMMRLLLGQVEAVEIMSMLVLLLFASALILWAGSRLFRLGLLTLGKRPTLRQVAQALRGV